MSAVKNLGEQAGAGRLRTSTADVTRLRDLR